MVVERLQHRETKADIGMWNLKRDGGAKLCMEIFNPETSNQR